MEALENALDSYNNACNDIFDKYMDMNPVDAINEMKQITPKDVYNGLVNSCGIPRHIWKHLVKNKTPFPGGRSFIVPAAGGSFADTDRLFREESPKLYKKIIFHLVECASRLDPEEPKSIEAVANYLTKNAERLNSHNENAATRAIKYRLVKSGALDDTLEKAQAEISQAAAGGLSIANLGDRGALSIMDLDENKLKISKKRLMAMIQEELRDIFSEELGDGMVQDPISPSGQMVSREELINDMRDGLELCFTKLEDPDGIDYELVILLGNALKRAQVLSGEEYP